MYILSIRVPECDIIFLIPLNFHEQLKKYDNSIKSLLNSFKKCGIVQNFEIPIDVKNPNELDIDPVSYTHLTLPTTERV